MNKTMIKIRTMIRMYQIKMIKPMMDLKLSLKNQVK